MDSVSAEIERLLPQSKLLLQKNEWTESRNSQKVASAIDRLDRLVEVVEELRRV
jgi:hypothetical protein